ncbi:MAG TPA: L-threonylcarbamoyladenylate synthase [Acidimicrobiia bacterium]|nr:L-threonylcarbamoyladenylate synthase [Acidimicrobiia bacterium]
MLPVTGPRPDDLAAVVAALRRGAVVGIPTDTVYGLAADPFSREAVALLFALKRRPAIKAIPILAASIEQAERVGVLTGPARQAAERHWPGALTLVVGRVPGLPDWVGNPARDSVGIRVPDHPAVLALLGEAGPLAVTSANRSGAATADDDAGARAIFAGGVAAYLPGAGAGGAPSTVVDFTGRAPRLLRAGPVACEGT